MDRPEIIITDQDLERIERLLDVLPPAHRAAAEPLEHELARARVVAPAQVPSDVVTMNSCIVFEDVETGTRAKLRLAGSAHRGS